MAQTLGRYHIISELGRGGMGVVYKALDPKLERFIAIKCLSDELSRDEIVVARFLREARSVAALNHPNIAQIFIADEQDGRPYFVMEYVDGESLADFIAREGQCSPEMARRVTEQSAEALAAAAAENIVHRDIKPGNIMLDRRGRAVLTDFGIACVANPSDEAGEASETLMGTPGYLPPESLSGQRPDCRGDLFALGLVYYEMLTGSRLVRDTGLKATLATYMQSDFPDLSALDGKVDERVIDILCRMLAVRPEQRYPDCRSLLEDMAPLKTGHTGPVEREPTQEPAATRVSDRPGPNTPEPAMTREIAPGAPTDQLGESPAQSPATVAVEEEARGGRGRRYALVGVLAASLAMLALGVARLDDAHWERMAALWNDDEDAASEQAAVADDLPAMAEASSEHETAPAGDVGGEEAGDMPADRSVREDTPSDELVEQIDEPTESPESSIAAQSRHAHDHDPAPVEVDPQADEEVSAQVAAGERSAAEAPAAPVSEPTEQPERPRGIAVIGVGDPVIADPMANEIEQSLREVSPPLVDRQFMGNYRRFIDGEEVDLSGLAEPAAEAGVRYLVVARALPAGSRELSFYNRVETAWIVQLEAKTFDLYLGREMASSPLEQVEYTALNATERARQSVEPWLPGLKAQFE
ncbi:protein kinase [Wenzhouxiangella sp. AB-CW3]|uniref:serine/threonine-protein kinase n=1 Tax=Wenzhouxiangella sp. AB-CW3 TaxID=2771012 RepID=UPI00168A6D2D|nr:serine/threonine-protein kinase [Wenzhouxiangella sp. AB-CW3]QOC22922.1 protein kinase [Wenzhouxiangella sp. AB-CW3]